jgi:hypothetical protein
MNGESSNKLRDDDDHIYLVDHRDLMVASWHLATLIYGPDDGSIERDDIECQMQDVMRAHFDSVHHFGPVDIGTTEDRIERAREFLRREVQL